MTQRNAAIYGAGSVGTHLAHACRARGWQVTVIDIDPEALTRMETMIFPERYGFWDPAISLVATAPDAAFDAVFVGTPPDSHIPIAVDALGRHTPRALVIEKPLCTPSLEGLAALRAAVEESRATAWIGYNHNLAPATLAALALLRDGAIGEAQSLHVRWQEHWGGIFAAHPWLPGPQASYLGRSARGGGATAEHSHGISIWQHVAHVLGGGRVETVSASMDFIETDDLHYDRTAIIAVRSEAGLSGSIVQDVVTDPPIKVLRAQGTDGYLELHINAEAGADAIVHGRGSERRTQRFPKSRADDFLVEVDHVTNVLDGIEQPSNGLESGIETALVIAAAHESATMQTSIRIDYDHNTVASIAEAVAP